MQAISGYEVLTRFYIALDTSLFLLLNPLVNHDLSFRFFVTCSNSFGHTVMQQSDIPISSHIQINACHAWDLHSWIRHLTPERKQELEAAARAARAARGPWDAS